MNAHWSSSESIKRNANGPKVGIRPVSTAAMSALGTEACRSVKGRVVGRAGEFQGRLSSHAPVRIGFSDKKVGSVIATDKKLGTETPKQMNWDVAIKDMRAIGRASCRVFDKTMASLRRPNQIAEKKKVMVSAKSKRSSIRGTKAPATVACQKRASE